ncbi:hypothetical protein [Synechocystis sp. LKSZ1]|uniref:hypothetical protein n=1 Tax=Synechocystis sp. LKSZ1 TaxID=3144951 RepID=UPI00336C2A5B
MEDVSLSFSRQSRGKSTLNRKGIYKLWWHIRAYAIIAGILVLGLLKLTTLVFVDSLVMLKSLQGFKRKNKIATKIALFP